MHTVQASLGDVLSLITTFRTLDSGVPADLVGKSGVVSLCARSDEQWHSGDIFGGLRINQLAVHQAGDGPAVWRRYANLALATKLSAIHVTDEAAEILDSVEDVGTGSGFEAVPSGVRAVLHLQAGRSVEAIDSARAAIRVAGQCSTTIGVDHALSVLAAAHVSRGERGEAAAALDAFRASRAPLDAVARAACAELALLAQRQGPHAAAERMRARWPRLGTASACFVEDVTRPAWLVDVARRAGDTALARRALRAIERLAAANPGITPPRLAEAHARRAWAGEPLDAPVPTAGGGGAAPPLSAREDEIARLVVRGMTNQQVARQLGLSPHTVNFHLRNIFRKLSISRRVSLAAALAQPRPATTPESAC